MALTDVKDRVEEMDKYVENIGNVESRLDLIETRIGTLEDSSITNLIGCFQGIVNEITEKLRSKMGAIMHSFEGQLKAVHEAIDAPKGDMALCKSALVGATMVREGPKVKVPEPSKFKGKGMPRR